MPNTRRTDNRSTRLVRGKFIWIRAVATDPRVSLLGCRVAVILLDHINSRSIEAWPSQATLGEHAGVTPRAIRNGLNSLEKNGYIETRRVGYRRSNRYRVNLPFFTDETGANIPADRKCSSTTAERSSRRFLMINPYNSSPIPSAKALSADERAAIGDELVKLAKDLGSRRKGGKSD